MTRQEIWADAIRDLARERGPLAVRKATGQELTRAELRLLRHFERELNFYEMKLLEPSFQRLEAEARSQMRLARSIEKLVAQGRSCGALP